MARNLVFVEQRSDMVSPGLADTVVVLDPTWTPDPDELPQIQPSRRLFASVVDRYNLFDESLERLDRWAEAAGAAELFSSGGVTWWMHARGYLRLDLHEMLVWCHILDDLAAEGPF